VVKTDIFFLSEVEVRNSFSQKFN